MKKNILLLLIVLLLCSCGKESIDSSSANTSSSIKTEISPTYIQVDCDMVVYDNFNDLLKNSDCVIVGTVNNILSTFPYYDGEGLLYDIYTKYEIKIDKTIYGDIKSDTIIVSQPIGYDDKHNQSINFSGMSPYQVGDKWIMFLYYDKEHDTYWTTGDFTGRYSYESSMDEAINNKDIDSLIKSLNIYKK